MDYDTWKTSPPDYPEPRTLEYCAQCGCELVEGDDVLHDGEFYFCDKEHFKKFLVENVDDYINEIIDMMIYKVTLGLKD